MPKEPKMLPADWLQYVADAERALKKPPNPPKRLQPKVTRHMSPRQRTALSQTKNPVRAIYQQESQYNVTPLLPDGAKTTKEVGPGDVNNSATNWRTGNMTVEPSINGNKVKPRHSHGSKGRKPSSDLDALLKEYGV